MIELVDVDDSHTVVTLSGPEAEVVPAIRSFFDRYDPYAFESRQIRVQFFRREAGWFILTQLRRRNTYLPKYRRDYE